MADAEIWDEIRSMRADHAALVATVKAGFAKVEAIVGERCEARLSRISRLEVDSVKMREDVTTLQRRVDTLWVKVAAWSCIGSTLGAALATAIFNWLLR